MIHQRSFTRLIDDFELNFEENYTDRRRNLLFAELSFLESEEVETILNKVLMKYNDKRLPTILEIKIEAFKLFPEIVDVDECDLNIAKGA